MERHSNLLSQGDAEPSVLIGWMLVKLQYAVFIAMSRARQRLVQLSIVFSFVFLILWIAAFLYGTFYYSYMPQATFSAPVNYYYRTDCESPASFLCSYPMANISLIRNKKHVLTFGQPYRMSLQLEMPDSPTNRELGMFMIKTTCFSQDGEQVASSARSGKHQLSASSSRFYAPSVTAVIEIMSSRVQIYSSDLYIHAHFTGIRYLLYNFPVISAIVGVSSNFTFLGFIFIFSYMRLLFQAKPQRFRMSWTEENNQQGEERAVPAGTAEMLGPFHQNPTDERQEEPHSHVGNGTEQQDRDTIGQGEINETEAA
ncbi:seipin-like isoform X3 [Neolamprologus brichardi]|uniref:seipin-like isoform X3 n=1 Tax=Neolamprologus brichardi TaxID=32507 RepID=UPI001643CCAD|nr:seipin-like isoform X3 [Neolamprologus brichardi]